MLCRFGLHDFGKWSAPKNKIVSVVPFSTHIIVQTKLCRRCGIVVERTVSKSMDPDFLNKNSERI